MQSQIVFPVIGPARLTNSFGDPRGQGAHQGEDIMSVRRALAVAAEPGKVRFHTGSGRAGCMLYLDATSGTKYVYVHLNNDLTKGNDNRGGCVVGVAFPPGLKDGQRVRAGQPIGFVGDSGDANGIQPHLHFEIHPKGRGPVAPYPLLQTARRLLFYAAPGAISSLTLAGKVIVSRAESLRLRISSLRISGGLAVTGLARPLTLAVPPTALVERATDPLGTLRLSTLLSAKPGDLATVWTQPAPATRAAQAGKDGVLSAERVLLRTP